MEALISQYDKRRTLCAIGVVGGALMLLSVALAHSAVMIVVLVAAGVLIVSGSTLGARYFSKQLSVARAELAVYDARREVFVARSDQMQASMQELERLHDALLTTHRHPERRYNIRMYYVEALRALQKFHKDDGPESAAASKQFETLLALMQGYEQYGFGGDEENADPVTDPASS